MALRHPVRWCEQRKLLWYFNFPLEAAWRNQWEEHLHWVGSKADSKTFSNFMRIVYEPSSYKTWINTMDFPEALYLWLVLTPLFTQLHSPKSILLEFLLLEFNKSSTSLESNWHERWVTSLCWITLCISLSGNDFLVNRGISLYICSCIVHIYKTWALYFVSLMKYSCPVRGKGKSYHFNTFLRFKYGQEKKKS